MTADPHDNRSFFAPLISDGRQFLSLGTLGLLLSGLFAIYLAATRQFLPHDVKFLGMSPAELCAEGACSVVHFMVHDRVSFGGALIALAILYFWLIHFPLKEGLRWAWWTLLISNIAGLLSFLTYLGFGYLDSWHAAATGLIIPCFAIGLAKTYPSLIPQQSHLKRRPLEWRTRTGFGWLLILATAVTMVGAGLTISIVGMTVVFVPQDLEYMHTTTAALNAMNPRLIPLIAHDRAGFGGAVFNVGLVLVACTWFARPSRALWQAFALASSVGFATAIGIHPLVGYNNLVHLAPACLGAVVFTMGLAFTASSCRWRTAVSLLRVLHRCIARRCEAIGRACRLHATLTLFGEFK